MPFNAARMWPALLALALLARALVPAGWMPAFDADGIRLVLCSGWGPMQGPTRTHHAAASDQQVAKGHHSAPGSQHDQGQGRPDQSAPCTFAAAACAAVLPVFTALVEAPVAFALPNWARLFLQLGQGLAAPPPPSTGPPLNS